jgi:hypothetical protein
MLRVVTITLALVLLLAVSIAAVHAVGTSLASPSTARAILAIDSCEQPCWHGIHPGQTTLRQAYELLSVDTPYIYAISLGARRGDAQSRDRVICWSITARTRWRGCAGLDTLNVGPIDELELSPPAEAFTLGEAVSLFDTPLAVEVCYRYTRVYFPHNIEVVMPSQWPPRFDPQQNIILVRFTYPGDEPPYRFDAPAWHGFTTWSGDAYC